MSCIYELIVRMIKVGGIGCYSPKQKVHLRRKYIQLSLADAATSIISTIRSKARSVWFNHWILEAHAQIINPLIKPLIIII